MKQIGIFISYKKVEENAFQDIIEPFKRQIFQSRKNIESMYREAGFHGLVMDYRIVRDELNEKDFIYFAIDYIARVCWAFHNQNQIDFLNNYKKVFFDFKINKIKEIDASSILFKYEEKNRRKTHGLVRVFACCSVLYKEQKFDSSFWCDGLMLKENSSTKDRIGIIYKVNDDYKIRALFNPLKISLFNPVQWIEHIESLNFVLSLAYSKIEKETDKQNFVKMVDDSWQYFIDNRQATDTIQESNEQVYRLVNEG
jgi:hypothetical protein